MSHLHDLAELCCTGEDVVNFVTLDGLDLVVEGRSVEVDPVGEVTCAVVPAKFELETPVEDLT